MMRLLAVFLYLSACSCATAANEAALLLKSKEEALSATTQSLQSSDKKKNDGPPLLFSPNDEAFFGELKTSHRNLSKSLTKGIKDRILGKPSQGNRKNAGIVDSMKEKAARFLFKQDEKKDFSKIMVQMKTIKDQMKTASNRRATQEFDFFPRMKEALSATGHDSVETYRDHTEEDDYTTSDNIFDQLNEELIVPVTSIDKDEYFTFIEGISGMVGAADITIPSPEDFCRDSDFNVTTTEDDCIAALSAVKTLVEGAIQAPWLIRDIVGYVEFLVNEIVSWDTVKAIVNPIMTMLGVDGTIDGALYAIEAVMGELDGEVVPSFEFIPQQVATEEILRSESMLRYGLDELLEGIEYAAFLSGQYLGAEFFKTPKERSVLHTEFCELFDLVPAHISAVVSCNYFEDVDHEDIDVGGINFCVASNQDLEDYTAELFKMESSHDVMELIEAFGPGPISALSDKFDNYDFMSMGNMTCSITGYPPKPPPVCNEKPKSKYFSGKKKDKTCAKLGQHKHKDLICKNLDTARISCPSTCCMCEEDPETKFFRKWDKEGGKKKSGKKKVPQVATCGWLSTKTPEQIASHCGKTKAPGNYMVASGACPTTCGLCGDVCQSAIDNFIEGESYLHFDYTSETVVFGDKSMLGLYGFDQNPIAQYGYFTGREGNTLMYAGGDDCSDSKKISSKVIVEASNELTDVTSNFTQTSACTYELTIVIPCSIMERK